MAKKVRQSVSMEPETAEIIDILAAKEKRSRSQMIMVLVEEAIQARQKGDE